MNIQETYAYILYQTKSFSKAAKKIPVSQPALSAMIKKLELQLGYEIFNRKTSPVSLTPKGELYIEYLEGVMELEKQLNNGISSINTQKKETISIGGSNSAAFRVIPKLCSRFHRDFPDVDIRIDTGELGQINNLLDKLEYGTLDLLIGGYQYPHLDSILLMHEKYILVAKNDFPGIENLHKYALSYNEAKSGIYPIQKEITDLNLFKNIPLFIPGKGSNATNIFYDLINIASPAPCKILSFRRMDMHFQLMLEGLGIALVSQSTIIQHNYCSDQLYYFAVSSPDNIGNISLLYKKGAVLSPYAVKFIELAKEMYCK